MDESSEWKIKILEKIKKIAREIVEERRKIRTPKQTESTSSNNKKPRSEETREIEECVDKYF